MSAQDNLNTRQFPTMSVSAVGKLRSGDSPSHTMGELAGDDYQRWDNDQSSPYYSDAHPGAYDALVDSVAQHGVQKPLNIGTHRGADPSVDDGHHRYLAAYDSGQSRVPVTGAVKAAKAATVYTPPGEV